MSLTGGAGGACRARKSPQHAAKAHHRKAKTTHATHAGRAKQKNPNPHHTRGRHMKGGLHCGGKHL